MNDRRNALSKNNEASATVPSGLKELDEALKGGFIRPSNLMITGAPLCGKKALGMKILSYGLETEEGVIYISTSQTAEEIRSYWLNYGLKPYWEERGQVRFVDCYSKMLGIQCTDTPSIRRIPSVLDFTKLTVTVAELCSNFLLKEIYARLVLDSLSSLLIYSSPQTVMRFLHIFTGKLRRQNVLSLFLVEEGTHDAATFNLLKTYSNGVIKMNERAKTIQLAGFVRSKRMSISYEVTEKSVILKELQQTPEGAV